MSAATAATADLPYIGLDTPHIPRTAHPIPLREQAFTLHCQGLRSPAIARDLGVPERTVRSWIAAALDEFREDQSFGRRDQLLIAVERQHALTFAAWQQFEAETAARAALLDAARAAFLPAATTSTAAAGEVNSTAVRPPQVPRLPATPAPRYLSLILQANKETNRLLGLYTLARLDLLTPTDSTEPASPANATENDNAAESATGIAIAKDAAASATAPCTSSLIPAPISNPHPAAESATASAMPESAAESATASATGPQATTRQPVLSHGGIAAVPASLHREDQPHVAGRSTQRVHAPGSERSRPRPQPHPPVPPLVRPSRRRRHRRA